MEAVVPPSPDDRFGKVELVEVVLFPAPLPAEVDPLPVVGGDPVEPDCGAQGLGKGSRFSVRDG